MQLVPTLDALTQLPAAQLTELFALAIPIVALLIPIVYIFTAHQRKMTELIHRSESSAGALSEVAGLREEVRQLKEVIHQQAISIDSLASNRSSALEERVRES